MFALFAQRRRPAPPAAVIHERMFAGQILDHEAYRAGWDAVRRAMPLAERAPDPVQLCPAAIDAFLGGGAITVTGRWEEAVGAALSRA